MARLESTAAGGYFPTPPRVVVALAGQLARAAGRGAVRLLDPCCGTGAAAAELAAAVGAESYGVELNGERAEHARATLDHVVAGSAFAVRLANGAFSVLFLNPPYGDDEAGRLEHSFLVSSSRALCPGGVLVLVVPRARLAGSARYLVAHYAGHRAWRFPDPEYAAFGQVVLLATRKPRPTGEPAARARIEVWAEAGIAPLPDVPDGVPLAAPTVPTGPVLFAPLAFEPAAGAAEARARGAWVRPDLAERLWPLEERPVRPLLPLRRGHLALLVAAGLVDGAVLAREGRRVLVKGRARKVMVEVEDAGDDPATLVEREVVRMTVAVLDLASGELETAEGGR